MGETVTLTLLSASKKNHPDMKLSLDESMNYLYHANENHHGHDLHRVYHLKK